MLTLLSIIIALNVGFIGGTVWVASRGRIRITP